MPCQIQSNIMENIVIWGWTQTKYMNNSSDTVIYFFCWFFTSTWSSSAKCRCKRKCKWKMDKGRFKLKYGESGDINSSWQYALLISPIQGQNQNAQQVSSCVKRNPKKTPAKSPKLLTPPDTPLAINLGDGKLKNSNKYIFCRLPYTC